MYVIRLEFIKSLFFVYSIKSFICTFSLLSVFIVITKFEPWSLIGGVLLIPKMTKYETFLLISIKHCLVWLISRYVNQYVDYSQNQLSELRPVFFTIILCSKSRYHLVLTEDEKLKVCFLLKKSLLLKSLICNQVFFCAMFQTILNICEL